ncbi:MAG: ABC transporter ATP-binding protein [Hyphomicrobiaceae bacterium]
MIRVAGVGKCYLTYTRPEDRLKQFILPRLQRAMGQEAKRYFREFWALQNISLDVQAGESVGIIGRNGSGKSTLLQMIAGTLQPTTGTVETRGRIAALLELGSGFNTEFTGRENVLLNAAILGLDSNEISNKMDEIAAFADIGEFFDQPVRTYSSGMVVRVAFAVSACVNPDILVVDEALAVGDASFQFKCLDRLKGLIASGTTLLFVSHDIGMVRNFCHRVIYLHKGEERGRGSSDEMAELYSLDLRDEQRKWLTADKGVKPKTFRGDRSGIAFGTEEGDILNAHFTTTGGQASSFRYGEDIELEVAVRYRDTVQAPSLALVVQDYRTANLGGQTFELKQENAVGGWHEATVRVVLAGKLARGRYYITVRLEKRISDRAFMPIDKQVGLLSFDVNDVQAAFIGPVDLGIRRTA